MKSLNSINRKDLSNKICLLRVDFNIEDEEFKKLGGKAPLRVTTIIPTVEFLIKNGARVLILSHRGRPNGLKVKSQKLKVSLKPFVDILSKLLGKQVLFADLKDGNLKAKMNNSKPGSVFLLENLRFYPGENKNDSKFAKKLASLGDIYVNDAFAASHRAQASIVAITKSLPSYAGFLLEKEIKNLNAVSKNPKRPLVIILGGAKVSDKLGLVNSFIKKADYFLVGGAIANTFLKAEGLPIGDSIFEEAMINKARGLLKTGKVILPVDLAVHDRKILDIGPLTIQKFGEIINKSRTIIWNGPLGFIEDQRFSNGSAGIALKIFQSSAFAVIGGGETTTLITSLKSQTKNLKHNVYLSTGGGAMLEYFAGKELPGIKALK